MVGLCVGGILTYDNCNMHVVEYPMSWAALHCNYTVSTPHGDAKICLGGTILANIGDAIGRTWHFIIVSVVENRTKFQHNELLG